MPKKQVRNSSNKKNLIIILPAKNKKSNGNISEFKRELQKNINEIKEASGKFLRLFDDIIELL